MTTELDHVHESIREITHSGSNTERLALLRQEFYVRHTMAVAALRELRQLQEDRGARPCAGAVIADSGIGKSQLFQALKRDALDAAKDDGAAPSEIAIVEPSFDSDPMRLLSEIASGIGVKPSGDLSQLLNVIVEHIRDTRLAGLCIEDLHDLFNHLTGRPTRSREDRDVAQCMKVLRRLINATLVPIIFSMLPSGIREVIKDPQLNDRILCKIYLPAWRASDRETVAFLDAYEKQLPLRRRSHLSAPETRQWLVRYAPSTRVMAQVIRETSRVAIDEGVECVSLTLLKKRYPTTPLSSEAGKAAARRRHQNQSEPSGQVATNGTSSV